MKTKYLILIIFTFPALTRANLLFELEKKRYENEVAKSELLNEIESAKKKIEINESVISEKKRTLAKFLKADQQLKQFEFGGLLAVEKPAQLNRNLKIFEILKNENLNSLRELKYFSQDLLIQKKELQKKVANLDIVTQQLIKQETDLKVTEKETLKKLISEKENSLLRSKGFLSTPVPSTQLIAQFGLQFDTKNKFSRFQKGLLYSTQTGQIVRAIGPGKIIFRDPIKYWGESIIIEHPGDYFSVYTNLKNCRVEVGQDVTQEDKLCETNKDEFYFELRNQSIAINPQNWIRN
jgi:septal ring factor EnvC (AmiA/AmiB activator)